jgi:hypothetical protein
MGASIHPKVIAEAVAVKYRRSHTFTGFTKVWCREAVKEITGSASHKDLDYIIKTARRVHHKWAVMRWNEIKLRRR